MDQYISMGLNIALLVFITFGFLGGIIRGLKKTAFRGLFLIITVIIALFITMPVTNLLLGIQIDITLNMGSTNISGLLTIKEILAKIIEGLLGEEFVTLNPNSVELILTLPIMVINTIIYVLIFFVLKYILLPINFLLYKLSFGRKPKIIANAFSAFNENDPNDIKNIFNIENTPDNQPNTTSQDQTISPLPNNIENQQANPFNSPENNMPDNTITPLINEEKQQEEVLQEEVQQPIDNSTFQPSNNVGTFLNNDEPVDNNEKDMVFNVSISKQTDLVDTPILKAKKKKKDKPKKYRLLGGLVGVVIGIFIMSNILLPLYGTMDILKEFNKIKLTNISETEVSLNTLTNGATNEIITGYDSSIFKFASTYTGFEGISLAEFDYLTTQKVGDKSINLRQDIKAIVETSQKIDKLIGKYKEFSGEGNLSDLSKDQISILLSNAKELITYIKSIEFISSATDFIIPATCTILLNSEMNLSNNEDINEMFKNCITAIKQQSKIDLFTEFTSFVDIIEYLNNKDILTKLLKNEFSDPFAIINSFDNEFTNKLFALKTVDVAIPHILNIGLTLVDESIEFGYVKNTADAETIKTALSDFFNKTLAFAKTIDKDSSIVVTNESLIPLGKVLQSAKTSGLINTQTYTNLIDFTSNKLQDIVSDIAPEEFEDYLKNEIIDNITKVDNWEYEMTIINEAILKLRNIDNGFLGEVKEGENLRQGLSIHFVLKESVLINLGETLDMLEETCIFGARTYKDNHQISGIASLMLSILDYINENVIDESSNDSVQKFSTVINQIKANVLNSDHTYSKDNPFWKNEFTYISPLVLNVYNMIDSENFDFDSSLGTDLDTAKASTLLGNGATITLVEVALDIAKEEVLGNEFSYNNGSNISNPQTINDKIYELFDSISTNLKTNTVINAVRLQSNFWEKEIEYYIDLTNVADKATSITQIDDAVELSQDLDSVYNSYTIPRSGINKIVAFAIKDTKYKNLSSSDKVKLAINETIDDISEKLNSDSFFDDKELSNFWTIEFNHIKAMTDIKFNDDNDYSVKENLTAIGQKLDNVTLGYQESSGNSIRGSYLVTHENLRIILGNAIDEMSDSLTEGFDSDISPIINTALESIKTNVHNTTDIPTISFEYELGKLANLSDINVSKDLITYPTGTLEEIETKLNQNKTALQNLGQELDNISFNYKHTTIYEYDEDKNSKIITRPIINTLIEDLFDLGAQTIESYDEANTRQKKESFNNLITNIQSEINAHSLNDSIISWKRELGYVNKLVTLNKNTVYTIENVATEIGKNIDVIAFNYTVSGSVGKFNDVYQNNQCTDYLTASNGNSLFITRTALKTTMDGFLSTVKYDTSNIADDLEKEQKEIINDIINNTTNVSMTNAELNSKEKFVNMEQAFEQLNLIDELISGLVEIMDGDIITIKSTLTSNDLNIDNILNTFEYHPSCQILITRRIANLMLKYVVIPSELTETNTYYNKLRSHYDERITNQSLEREYYETDDAVDTNSTRNPFDTLLSTVTTN